jgi:hypothetical protein
MYGSITRTPLTIGDLRRKASQGWLLPPGSSLKKLLSQGGSVLAYFQIVNFLLFGICGGSGAPFYIINNMIGAAVDKMLHNSLFCLNFAILANKALLPSMSITRLLSYVKGLLAKVSVCDTIRSELKIRLTVSQTCAGSSGIMP